MSVVVSFEIPEEFGRIESVKTAMMNAALFVRDLWLARAPYSSGAYARGLLHSGSVKVTRNEIRIENKAKHAAAVEFGFRSYNLGLAILNGGKGVKTGPNGRYKIIKIEDKGKALHRKASVAEGVMRSFQKLKPMGLRPPKISRYGAIKPYKPKRALERPLKSQPGRSKGFFVISEKSIREDSSKWQMPSREGLKLGQKIQKEARPYVVEALRQAIQAETDRQARTGRGVRKLMTGARMRRNILKVIPVGKRTA